MKRVAVSAGAALAALACAASGQAAAVGATSARADVARIAGAAASRWSARTVLAESGALAFSNQVVDGAARVDYALVSNRSSSSFRLRRIPLSGAAGLTGPRFPVNGIGLGVGSVWVFGARPAGGSNVSLVLYQVNRSTLTVIRRWRLSGPQGRSGLVAVTPGSGGTEWVGFLGTIWRINASSGAVVSRIRVSHGLTISDVSTNPSGRLLYVAANTSGGGSAVLQYSARTGRKLASNARGDLRFSVGGARLTAAPGGVWVSFRTGMLGETVLLRQSDLRMVKLPGVGRPGSLFAWAMFANTEFAGRSLFLARLDGRIGCMNPGTGFIRARGRVSRLINSGQLIGAAPSGRVLYGLARAGVIAITPPVAC
jgi:hypothetical protein